MDINPDDYDYLVSLLTPISYTLKNSGMGYQKDINVIRPYLSEYLKTGRFLNMEVNDNFNIVLVGRVPYFSSLVGSYSKTISKLTTEDILNMMNQGMDEDRFY